MSEKLTAAAAALGLPEALVERSAAARAAETGASADDILTEWAGGEAASASAPPAEAAVSETSNAEDAAEDDEETPSQAATPPTAVQEIVIDVPARPETAAPVPTGPYKPPVLVGARDNPMTILLGAIGLFIMIVLVGLVGPSISTDIAGARSSEIPYTESAQRGRDIYTTSGCAACHTQMVRPVIADVGLGAVTLTDTNQVLGTRRFGPDLSDLGSRMTADQIEAVIGGLGSHPSLILSSDMLTDLVAYLSESRTSGTEQS
ncbi:MAG TPA: cbb3-type cytochrome c oxidase subunit II [Acidimicrobiia bacterium]